MEDDEQQRPTHHNGANLQNCDGNRNSFILLMCLVPRCFDGDAQRPVQAMLHVLYATNALSAINLYLTFYDNRVSEPGVGTGESNEAGQGLCAVRPQPRVFGGILSRIEHVPPTRCSVMKYPIPEHVNEYLTWLFSTINGIMRYLIISNLCWTFKNMWPIAGWRTSHSRRPVNELNKCRMTGKLIKITVNIRFDLVFGNIMVNNVNEAIIK